MRLRALLCAATLLSVTAVAQTSPARPAITGIAFARFYVTDAAAAKHFYADTVGLAPIASGDTTEYPVNSLQWVETVPLPSASTQTRMAAVGFTTRDVKAMQAYLGAKGFAAATPVADGQFSVRDPEGNLVYFVQTGSNAQVAAAKASPRTTSTRIIHVGFAVKSRAAEDRFYREVLGFKPYWYGGMQADKTDWVSLQVPDGTDWLEYMLSVPPAGDLRQLGVLNHFSLGTAEMQDVVAKLKANQCEGPNCTKTQMGKDGKVQLNLFDPDLSRVEYMEYAPREQPCCSPFTGKQPGPVEVR